MSSPPWMPFYVGDYIGGTMHLSTVEHGAYMLLIMHYWQKGSLPTEDRNLASIVKLTVSEWSDIRPTIAAFFEPNWRHDRVEAELASAQQAYSKRKAAGLAGASARYGKGKARAQQPKSQPHREPQPPLGSSSENLVEEVPSAKSKSEEGRKVEVSPSDPFLNGTLPEWREHYTAPVIAELQFKFESQAVEDLLPDLWEWSGTKTSVPSERMKLIYKTLKNKHAAATEGPALMAEKSTAAPVSPQLLEALAKKSRRAPAEPDLPAFLDRRKSA